MKEKNSREPQSIYEKTPDPFLSWRAPRQVRGNPPNQALHPTAAAVRDFEARCLTCGRR
jgi:hypothetical protein